MVGMLALPMASASDIDGDGVEDSSDDCPYAQVIQVPIELVVRIEMAMVNPIGMMRGLH